MAIFNAITTLVTSAEFNSDQMDFVSKNFQIFEEDEENKHEYKQVYEDYCNIMDRCIEAKLKEEHNFSDADIQNFMSTFKDNMSLYKETSADTFDILFGFIDFDQFKQVMLQFKKSSKVDSTVETAATSESDVASSGTGQDFAAAWDSFNKEINEPMEGKGCPWTRKLAQNEYKGGLKCQVWQRKYDGLSNDLVRMDCSMKNIDMDTLVEHFMNPPPDNSGMVQEMKVIEEISDSCKIMYWRIKMPMMSARDNVMKMTKCTQGDGQFFIVETIERPDYPVIKGVVRMFIYTRGYVRPSKESPSDTLDYTEMTVMNMGGYMPARLLNMVLASEAEKEFRKMYTDMLAKKA